MKTEIDPYHEKASGILLALNGPSEIEWINHYFENKACLTRDEIDSVLYFSLIWNIFEGIVCNKNATINSFEKAVNNLQSHGKLQLSDFEQFLSYFKVRYTTKGIVNQRFRHLKFRQNDREALVSDVLAGNEKDPVNNLLAMLIIIYRYRNNLFHGVKSVKTMPGQRDNFRVANQLLMAFLERW